MDFWNIKNHKNSFTNPRFRAMLSHPQINRNQNNNNNNNTMSKITFNRAVARAKEIRTSTDKLVESGGNARVAIKFFKKFGFLPRHFHKKLRHLVANA